MTAALCWHCGATRDVNAPDLERVSDVFDAAKSAGMIARLDEPNKRVLVFCDEVCADRNRIHGRYAETPCTRGNRKGDVISSVYAL